MEVDPLIAKLERRDVLTSEEKAVLEDVCSAPKTFSPQQDMIREGDKPRESTLLLSGICGRYNDVLDGQRQITALHIPGDFVDLHSFLLHRMDHGVVALTECTVTTVSHETLRAVTERFPHLTRMLWLSTLIDAAIHRRWLVAMGRLSSLAQLAHLICELRTRLEVVGMVHEDLAFDLPLTQTEVADVLGVSLVHVNRIVQQLKRDGLITWNGRRITILNHEKLVALAEFVPDYLNLEAEPR
jgi:CRP-like cAMP-binding protein